MVKEKGWKKRTARDLLALGSIVFYLLVFARSLIGPFNDLVYQLVFAGATMILISIFTDNYDGYVSRSLILLAFVSLFYADMLFGVFAVLAFVGVVVSARYLGSTREQLVKGFLVGAVSTAVGYYVAPLL